MIIIRTREQLKEKLDKTIVAFCVREIEAAYNSGATEVKLKILRRLFPPTYRNMPAMFGPSGLQHRVQYERVRSFLKGEFIVVIASDAPIPITFFARGVKALENKGIFKVPKDEVPVSYRYRSKEFAKKLTKALSRKIRVFKTPTHIKFKP